MTRILATDSGLDLIADEREHQLAEKGYSDTRDDRHVDGMMAAVAACYAHPRFIYVQADGATRAAPYADAWPATSRACRDNRLLNRGFALMTPQTRLCRKARIRELAIAGALLAAEIDRLQRVQVALDGDEPLVRGDR